MPWLIRKDQFRCASVQPSFSPSLRLRTMVRVFPKRVAVESSNASIGMTRAETETLVAAGWG